MKPVNKNMLRKIYGKAVAVTPAKKTVESKSQYAFDEVAFYLKSRAIGYVYEHKFHPDRKWRFDLAIPEHKIALEYEGIYGGKSRHTTVSGYTADSEKYNQAAILGWRVLRYTAKNKAQAIQDILTLLQP
jgi:hypothetical protein